MPSENKWIRGAAGPMLGTWFQLLFVTALFALSLFAQDVAPRRVFVPYKDIAGAMNPIDKAIMLRREEFERLLLEARRQRSGNDHIDRAAIIDAAWEGRVQDRHAQFSGTLQIESRSDHPVPVELSFADVAVDRITLDQQPAPLNYSDTGQLLLIVTGKGRHVLQVNASASLQELDTGGMQLSISLPQAASGSFRLDLPGDQEAHANLPVTSRDYDRQRDRTTITLATGGHSNISLAMLGNGRREEDRAILLGESASSVQLSPSGQELSCFYTIRVLRRGVRDFTFRLPAVWTVSSVTSPNLVRWSIAVDGEEQRLTVRMRTALRGSQALHISGHATNLAQPWQSPFIVLEQADFQRGYLLVDTGSELKVRSEERHQARRQNIGLARGIAGLTGTVGRLYFHWGAAPGVRLDLARLSLRRETTESQELTISENNLHLRLQANLMALDKEMFDVVFDLPPESSGWQLTSVRVGSQTTGFRQTVEAFDDHRQLHLELAQSVPREGVTEIEVILNRAGKLQEETADGGNIFLPLIKTRAQRWDGIVKIKTQGDLDLRPVEVPAALEPITVGRMTALGLNHEVRFAYQYNTTPEGQLGVEVRRRQPIFTAESVGLITIGTASVTAEYRLDYRVTRGGTRRLFALIDKSLGEQVNISARGWRVLSTRVVTPGADTLVLSAPLREQYQLWEIAFDGEVRGLVSVRVQASMPTGPSEVSTVIPLIRPSGVEQANEMLAVEAREELALTLDTEGMSELDAIDLPILPRQPRRVLAAYRLKQGAAIELPQLRYTARIHPPYAVPQAMAEHLQLTTVIGADGSQETLAIYQIRNSGVQFLHCGLPPNAQLWSAKVGAVQVKPNIDENGDYQISLPYTRMPMAVEILFKVPPTEGWPANFKPLGPTLRNVTINRTLWKLYPPPGWHITDLDGDVSRTGVEKNYWGSSRALGQLFDSLFGVELLAGLPITISVGMVDEQTKEFDPRVYASSPLPASEARKRSPAEDMGMDFEIMERIDAGDPFGAPAGETPLAGDPFGAPAAGGAPFGDPEDYSGAPGDPFGAPGEMAFFGDQVDEVTRRDSFKSPRHLAEGYYTLPISLGIPLVGVDHSVSFESLNVPMVTVRIKPASRAHSWFLFGMILSVAIGFGLWLKKYRSRRCQLSSLLFGMALGSALLGLWLPSWADFANGFFIGVSLLAIAFLFAFVLHRGYGMVKAGVRVFTLLALLLLFPTADAGESTVRSSQASGSGTQPGGSVPRIILPYSGDPTQAEHADKVVIPYDYYIRLWNRANPGKQIRAELAGTRIEISDVRYHAVLEGREIVLTLTVQLKTRGNESIRLPLPFKGLALTAATFDGQPATLQGNADGALLLLPANRQGLLTLTARTTPTIKGRQGELRLQLPPLPMAVMELWLPDPDLEVEVPGIAGVIHSRPQSTGSLWTIPLGSMTTLNLRWSPKVGTGAADRTLTANASHQVHSFHWGVFGISTLEYSFSAGEHDRFEFLLPANLELTQVTGANLRDYRVAESQTIEGQDFRVIGVRLHQPAKQTFSMAVRWLGGLPELGTPALLRLPQAGGVGRESGNVHLYAAGEMAVKVTSVSGGRRASATAGKQDGQQAAEAPHADLTSPVTSYYWPYRPFSLEWQLDRLQTEPRHRLMQLVRILPEQIEASTDALLEAVNGQLFGASFLLPADYEVLSANGANVEDWYIQEAEGRRLLHVAFRQAVQSTRVAVVLINEQSSLDRLEVPLLRVIDTAGRAIPEQSGELAVQVAPAYDARTIDSRNLRSLPPARLLPWLQGPGQIEAVQFAYDYEGPDAALALGIRRLPAQVRAELFTGVTIHPTAAAYTCRLRYRIEGSAIDRVSFSMPAAYASLVEVQSNAMRSVEDRAMDGDRHQWTVSLLNEVTGTLDIAVNFSLPIDSQTIELPIPRIQTQADAGYRSIIAVQNVSRHEVDFVASDELRPLPLEEQLDLLNPELRDRLQYIYHSFRPEWTARLLLKPAEPARRLDAIIDLMALQSVLDRNGELRYQVTLSIQNRTEQFLHVQLPPDTRIWSASVAGEQVKPVIGALAGNHVLIPLVKTSAHGLPYPVRLVVAGRAGKKIRGITRIQPPRITVTNVPVKRTTWSLLVPEEFTYTWVQGNMSRAAGTVELMTYSIDAQLSQLDRLARQYSSSEYSSSRQKKAAAENLKLAGEDVVHELSRNRKLLEQQRYSLDGHEYKRLSDKLSQQDQSQQGVLRQLQQSEGLRAAGALNVNGFLNTAPNIGIAETMRNAGLNHIPAFVANAQSSQLLNIRSEFTYNVAVLKDMDKNPDLLAQAQEKDDLFAEVDQKRQLGEISRRLMDERAQQLSQRQEELQGQISSQVYGGRAGVHYGRRKAEVSELKELEQKISEKAQKHREQQTAKPKVSEWNWMDDSPQADLSSLVGRDRASQDFTGSAPSEAQTQAIRNKLRNTIIPKISFEDTPVSTVFDFLKTRSRELDPEGVGVNFQVFLRPQGDRIASQHPGQDKLDTPAVRGAGADTTPSASKWREPSITLDFDNMPLGEIIRYVCKIAGLRYEVEEHAIIILGPNVTRGVFERRLFVIDTFVLSMKLGTEIDFKEYLEVFGVTFPTSDTGEVASIEFKESSTLIVRNTPENLNLIEKLLPVNRDYPAKPFFESKTQAIRKKLRDTIIPKISFEDTPVSTVFDFLKTRSRELDPEGMGVNFLIILRPRAAVQHPGAGYLDSPTVSVGADAGSDPFADPADTDGDPFAGFTSRVRGWKEPTIFMDFDNIPLNDAIRYICEGAGLDYRIEEHAIVITGPDVSRGHLELGFIPIDVSILSANPGEEIDFKEYLENRGVTFPEDAAVELNREFSTLIVRNTSENLRLIEMLFQEINSAPSEPFAGPETTAGASLGVGSYPLDMSLDLTGYLERHIQLDFYHPGPDAEVSVLAIPEHYLRVAWRSLGLLLVLGLVLGLNRLYRRIRSRS